MERTRMGPSRARWVIAAFLVPTIWAEIGCTNRITSDRDLVLVDPAEAVKLVDGQKRLLDLGSNAAGAWVDPRGESQFRAGHIPGAISLPFQNVTADHDKLKGYDVLIVYGDDYHDPKAEGMSKRLLELGFKDVRTLRGGLQAWADLGHPVETGNQG